MYFLFENHDFSKTSYGLHSSHLSESRSLATGMIMVEMESPSTNCKFHHLSDENNTMTKFSIKQITPSNVLTVKPMVTALKLKKAVLPV